LAVFIQGLNKAPQLSVATSGKAVYVPCVDGLYKVLVESREMKIV
jgi:hypothetical protein